MNAEADTRFDGIVIGSGIGGLACACALTRSGYKVLVLERHYVAGGLTQTFSRNGFTWDVGVHYLILGQILLISLPPLRGLHFPQ
jgi:all-trans-retinol 13,14-reductase